MKLNITYKPKDTSARGIDGFYNRDYVITLSYGINNNELVISNIQNLAKFEYDKSDNHLGTDILNKMLVRLYRNGETFRCIKGKLSSEDAKNFNWLSSIKFYQDFCKWLDKELDYKLTFHLYDDVECSREIFLPISRKERDIFIKEFTNNHITLNKDAYFIYDIN